MTAKKTDKTDKTDKTNGKDNNDNNNTPDVMSASEKKELQSYEASIRAANRGPFNQGRAFGLIRSKRLYRATHRTFDLYAKEKWDVTRARVSQLVSAARIRDMLKGAGFKVLPVTESQCRPFARIELDMDYDVTIKAIWGDVVGCKEPVTAKLVTDKVADKIGKPEPSVHTGAGAGSNAGDNDGADAGQSGADASGVDNESASAEQRAEIRELKAKIAYLESALAAEKAAHKRTRQVRRKSIPQSKLAKDLFKAGFRAMSKKHHPDLGGDLATMNELNKLKTTLGV